MDISKAKLFLSTKAGRTGLLVKKYSPEILIAGGIVGLVVGTAKVVSSTGRANEIISVAKADKEDIRIATERNDPAYSDADRRKDLSIVYTRTGFNLVKTYAPGVTLVVASVVAILGAHGIMKKRNIAIAAAYKLVEQGFDDYRARVVNELGDDADRRFRYGVVKEKYTEEVVGEDGKVTKVKKEREFAKPSDVSQYSVFFDDTCSEWSSVPEYNKMTLKSRETYATNLLIARGHLFLNEVYDMLGVPRTQAGAVVGWVISKDGDNYVDFGLYRNGNEHFINGYESSILLDFNVDGVIFDLI